MKRLLDEEIKLIKLYTLYFINKLYTLYFKYWKHKYINLICMPYYTSKHDFLWSSIDPHAHFANIFQTLG